MVVNAEGRKLFIALGVLQLFIGLGAIAAGYGFIMDPSGNNLSIPTELLKNAPFETYLIPGIVLFTVNGISTLAGAVLSLRRHRYSGMGGIILGSALTVWIIVQVYWIGLISWMQPFYFGLGLLEILLGYGIINNE